MKNKRLVMSPLSVQLEYLEKTLRKIPELVELFDVLESLNLPNWYIAGGILYQPIWNQAHGFNLLDGIKDIDVMFFDSHKATAKYDQIITNQIRALLPNFPLEIEAVNQARAHQWYEKDYALKIEPYTSTEESIFCVSAQCMVIGLTAKNNNFDFFAPFGVSDIIGLIVRPSKIQKTKKMYEDKINRWQKIWPQLMILPYDSPNTWNTYTKR